MMNTDILYFDRKKTWKKSTERPSPSPLKDGLGTTSSTLLVASWKAGRRCVEVSGEAATRGWVAKFGSWRHWFQVIGSTWHCYVDYNDYRAFLKVLKKRILIGPNDLRVWRLASWKYSYPNIKDTVTQCPKKEHQSNWSSAKTGFMIVYRKCLCCREGFLFFFCQGLSDVLYLLKQRLISAAVWAMPPVPDVTRLAVDGQEKDSASQCSSLTGK